MLGDTVRDRNMSGRWHFLTARRYWYIHPHLPGEECHEVFLHLQITFGYRQAALYDR